MTKIQLEKKISKLNKEWFYLVDRKYSATILQKIVDLCEPYLKDHPQDTDIWIKLALAVYTSPFCDDTKAMECMNEILSYDPLNPYALIILTYMESHWSGITDTTFEKLCSVQVEDGEVMSMIEYIKSWYYLEHKNYELYQKTLEKSVALCQNHIANLIALGGLYTDQGRIEEGKKLTAIGTHNSQLKHAMRDNKYFDITDMNHFLEERIK